MARGAHIPPLGPLFPAFTTRVDAVGFLAFHWGTWVGLVLPLALHGCTTLRRVHPVTSAELAWCAAA